MADISRDEHHNMTEDLREVNLGYFYHFTLTFIGFTTFHYLENLLLFLQKRMK